MRRVRERESSRDCESALCTSFSPHQSNRRTSDEPSLVFRSLRSALQQGWTSHASYSACVVEIDARSRLELAAAARQLLFISSFGASSTVVLTRSSRHVDFIDTMSRSLHIALCWTAALDPGATGSLHFSESAAVRVRDDAGSDAVRGCPGDLRNRILGLLPGFGPAWIWADVLGLLRGLGGSDRGRDILGIRGAAQRGRSRTTLLGLLDAAQAASRSVPAGVVRTAAADRAESLANPSVSSVDGAVLKGPVDRRCSVASAP